MSSTYRGVDGAGSNSTAVSGTVSKTVAIANGDLLVAVVTTAAGGGTISPAPGWRKLFQDSSGSNVAVFAKIASAEGAGWQFDWQVARAWALGIFSFYTDSAAIPKFKPELEAFATKTFNPSPSTMPAITANRSGDLVLGLTFSTGGTTAWNTWPAGYANTGDFVQTGTTFGLIYKLDAASGAQSTASVTASNDPAFVAHLAFPLYYARQGAVL